MHELPFNREAPFLFIILVWYGTSLMPSHLRLSDGWARHSIVFGAPGHGPKGRKLYNPTCELPTSYNRSFKVWDNLVSTNPDFHRDIFQPQPSLNLESLLY